MPPLCCKSRETGGADCYMVQNCDRCQGAQFSCNPHGFECFVRNVLTRALAELILDVGAPTTRGVATGIVETLLRDLPARQEFAGKPRAFAAGVPDVYELNESRRRSLAHTAADKIIELASTYNTQVAFRNRVLLKTPRGKQLARLYMVSLPAIWEVARRRYDLIESSRQLWLELHPLVATIVRLADDRAGLDQTRHGSKPVLRITDRHFQAIAAVAAEFRKETKSRKFQRAIDDVMRELKRYVGLTAEEALGRLRATRAR
jgi:hypothetical protein